MPHVFYEKKLFKKTKAFLREEGFYKYTYIYAGEDELIMTFKKVNEDGSDIPALGYLTIANPMLSPSLEETQLDNFLRLAQVR